MSTPVIFRRSTASLLSRRLQTCPPPRRGHAKKIWTARNEVRSPFADVYVPTSMTLAETVWQNLERWPNKTAVVCGATGLQYSYHQVFQKSHSLAANLRGRRGGLRDGEVIAAMLPNCPQYVVAALGALRAGAELTTINPIYTPHEVKKQLLLSKPKIIFCNTTTVKVIKEALNLAEFESIVIVVKNSAESLPEHTVNFEELTEDKNVDYTVLREVRRTSDDSALLLYSSGTTGLPKGVDITNYNAVANLAQMSEAISKHYEDTTASYQESVLAVLPFYHIYGLVVIMLHKLSVGAKLVSLPRLQPEIFSEVLREHRVSLFYAAPPLVLFAGAHKSVTASHVAWVRRVYSGAAPLPAQDIARLQAKLPSKAHLFQVYGLTETSPLATHCVPGAPLWSAGYAVSNTKLRVAADDADGTILGPGEKGELQVLGPQVMRGYKDNEEATRAAFTEDGWFRTGDLAHIDEQGAVCIADRLKELIKVKGYQVPPAELESVIKEHNAVLDAAVVGVSDPRAGELPRAFVVLQEDKKADAEDIKQFVAGRVAEFKRLKDVVFLPSLPKNPSGKILRRILKEQYCKS